MTKAKVTQVVDGEIQVEEVDMGKTQPFTAVVHPQGMKVDFDEFTEINPTDTVACVDKLKQNEWEWISQGDLFKTLWSKSFDPKNLQDPPANVDVLKLSDLGVKHIAGMIILGCETCMNGGKPFFRLPETYLHPASQRYIGGMLQFMQQLFNGTATKTDLDEEPEPEGENDDFFIALQYLSNFDKEKPAIKFEGREITVGDLITEIAKDTPAGKFFVEEFAKRRKFNPKGAEDDEGDQAVGDGC